MNVDTSKYDCILYRVINKLGDLRVNNSVDGVFFGSCFSFSSNDFLKIFLIIDNRKISGCFDVRCSPDVVADEMIRIMLEKVTGTLRVTDIHNVTKKYLLFEQEPLVSWGENGPEL